MIKATPTMFKICISLLLSLPLTIIFAEGDSIPLSGEPSMPAVPSSVAGNSSGSIQNTVKKPSGETTSILKRAAALFGGSESKKQSAPKVKIASAKQANKKQKKNAKKIRIQNTKKKEIKAIPVINVRSGPNYVIPVALNHSNRIVTPFKKPKVVSSVPEAEADISTQRNVIYVTPFTSAPVTMFIKEGNDETNAISLTLAPKRMAPVVTKVVLHGMKRKQSPRTTRQSFREYKAPKEARRWEKSESYESTLKKLLQVTATGYTPPGYKMRRIIKGIDENPECSQSGISYSLSGGYIMQGHHFNVQIIKATNRAKKAIQIQENKCENENIAAASAWPHSLLEPGQSTEFYIVYINRSKSNKRNGKTRRPSLLN